MTAWVRVGVGVGEKGPAMGMQACAGPRVSAVIATHNRADDVVRCVRSLERIAHLGVEALVLDDGSSDPIEPRLRRELGDAPPVDVTYLRHDTSRGTSASRNALAQAARGEYLLSLDDDAYLLDADAVEASLHVLDADPRAGAVAMAQVHADGQPFGHQPGDTRHPALVRAFFGYGALIRRSLFLELGGYRELFHYYAEEPELCKRMLAAGYHVVYLPEARVAHVPNPNGRNLARITAQMWRNSCYGALLNDPVERAVLGVPARLTMFMVHRRRLRRQKRYENGDARQWGLGWIVRELMRDLPRLLRQRKALPRATCSRWRTLDRPQPYELPDGAGG